MHLFSGGTHNEGASSIALSSEAAYTEITLPESSGQHTPPRGQNIGNEANPEVVLTPHAPTASMRFDTLEDAQWHYLAFARRRGFGIRYNYRKKI
jgi:hypothetical protein